MCKIMAVAGITNQKNFIQFMRASVQPMTKSDPDAFGYAAHDGATLFYEKWNRVDQVFKTRSKVAPETRRLMQMYGDAVEIEETYRTNDTPTFKSIKAAILHSRFATCGKGIENAHPFVAEDQTTALIHNGIIRNADKYLKMSTCDSEALLTRYIESGVAADYKKLPDALQPLTGYYACAVLSNDGTQPILDIFKDNQAQLYLCRVKELGDVFCTSADIVRVVCAVLKWKAPQCHKVADYSHIRINAVTGTVVTAHRFTVDRPKYISRGKTYNWEEYSAVQDQLAMDDVAKRSLGYLE